MFIERCKENKIENIEFFIKKLESVNKLVDVIYRKNKKYYQISNIVWPSNIIHLIEKGEYPSQFFRNIINTLLIWNDRILNTPTIYRNTDIAFVLFDHNKLLMLDALFKQGSIKRYLRMDGIYVYSEHHGVFDVKDGIVKNIILSAETNRSAINDEDILLPNFMKEMNDYHFIFHTHPNSNTNAGRISGGILYEFPSPADIMNFCYHNHKGITVASIIVSPEGVYIIKEIEHMRIKKKIPHDIIQKKINELEKLSISEKKDKLSTDDSTFHSVVSYDFKYIDIFNNILKQFNIVIDYYPRIKINDEWCIPSFILTYPTNEFQ